MSVERELQELAVSLQCDLEAWAAELGGTADAGTEEWRAWLLILEQLGRWLPPARVRHWAVLIGEDSGIEDFDDLREALGLTGGMRDVAAQMIEELHDGASREQLDELARARLHDLKDERDQG